MVAESTLRSYQGLMESNPAAAGQMLVALDFFLGPTKEIVLVGRPSQPETLTVLHAIRSQFLPNKVLAMRDPEQTSHISSPLFTNRESVDGQLTAYVCENFVCSAPLVGEEAILSAF